MEPAPLFPPALLGVPGGAAAHAAVPPPSPPHPPPPRRSPDPCGGSAWLLRAGGRRARLPPARQGREAGRAAIARRRRLLPRAPLAEARPCARVRLCHQPPPGPAAPASRPPPLLCDASGLSAGTALEHGAAEPPRPASPLLDRHPLQQYVPGAAGGARGAGGCLAPTCCVTLRRAGQGCCAVPGGADPGRGLAGLAGGCAPLREHPACPGGSVRGLCGVPQALGAAWARWVAVVPARGSLRLEQVVPHSRLCPRRVWGWGWFLAAGAIAVPAGRGRAPLPPCIHPCLPQPRCSQRAPGAVPVLWQRAVGTGGWQPAGPGASCSILGVRTPRSDPTAGRQGGGSPGAGPALRAGVWDGARG